jgi:anaerobic magnesium-protoporphyrin IX monomethyl ester cyclase
LDALPMPAYDLLPLDRYFSPSTSLNTISFITSRGCPYNCAFCSKLRKKEYHYLSTEKVLQQIDVLVNSHGMQWIEFVDEIFTLHKERTLDICEQIRSKGLRFQWGMATRADAIDEELLVSLKRAGCKKISFGIETGSERVRFAAHKKITNQRIIESIRLCKKHAIKTMGDFIFGHPTETYDEMRQTVSFSRKCGLHYAYFSRMLPIPNSEIFESAVKAHEITPGIWVDFMKGQAPLPIYTPHGMSPDKIKRIYKRAWISMYFWPTTLWRNRSVLFDVVRLFRTFIVLLKSISDKRYTK